MELCHLRYFIVVVEWKSYREASRESTVPQPDHSSIGPCILIPVPERIPEQSDRPSLAIGSARGRSSADYITSADPGGGVNQVYRTSMVLRSTTLGSGRRGKCFVASFGEKEGQRHNRKREPHPRCQVPTGKGKGPSTYR